MSLTCEKLISFLEALSPSKYAYDWDNVGLLIGDKKKSVNKIMVALDATESVVDEAIDKQVDLLITHHPMIFKGLKKITTQDFLGRKILKLIENKIALYSAHTNLDAVGSLSDLLARRLDLKDIQLLDVQEQENLYKLVVYSPMSHAENVYKAVCDIGAGHIGNYSHCSFQLEGEGTFKPLDGAQPFIGEVNEIEKVKEIRMETLVKEKDITKTIEAMLRAHPYEEVAYDLYPLHQKGEGVGIGRVGRLEKPMTLNELCDFVKGQLGLESVRAYGDLSKVIENIGVCPGKGTSYINKALQKQVDVMITGDIDYHTAVDTLQEGLPLIDADHFGTEHIIVDYLINILQEEFKLSSIQVIKANEKISYVTL